MMLADADSLEEIELGLLVASDVRVAEFEFVGTAAELAEDVAAAMSEEALVADGTADPLEEVVQFPPGTLRDCPTSKVSQLTLGFAALRAASVTPSVVAIL